MPALKEIPRSAYVAWSPSESHQTLLALGGRGVNAQLDLVDINLGDTNRKGYDIPVSVDLGGNPVGCLSWSLSEDPTSAPLGYLAAGFDDGLVKLWNPSEFLKSGAAAHSRDAGHRTASVIQEVAGRSLVATVKYDQPATCLAFNPIRPSLIACGYKDGMMNIVNIDKPNSPEIYEPGSEPAKAHGSSSVTAVAWNKTVQHILASTCSNGSTTIWNLRQRKPSIRFRDPAGRTRPSSVAWLPNQSTQVVVAYDDDTNPSFQMWDLRNSSYPFKEFPGHTRGIVDIEFCDLDPMLMVSSGKDNRIVCWALDESGGAPTIYSEVTTPEWHDSVRWSPCLPGLIASSSHIEGVVVESIQERRNPTTKHIPRWHKRPSGVSFGFGGKLVSFNETTGALVRCDVISSTDADLIRQADEFETTLVNGDYLGYCEKRIRESEDEHEKLTWQVVQTLFYPSDQRSGALLDKLGYKVNDVLSSVEAYLGHKPGEIFQMDTSSPQQHGRTASSVEGVVGSDGLLLHGSGMGAMMNGFYDESAQAVQAMLNQSVDAESFFNNLGDKGSAEEGENDWDETVGQSGAGSTGLKGGEEADEIVMRGGAAAAAGSKTTLDAPRLSVDARDYSTGGDLLIKTSMLLGQRAVAVEMCMQSERWADALLLAATSGDQTLWEKTQNLYLKRRSNDKFMQMVGCIISESWDELVKLADLSKWEETLAILASYVPLEQFPALASELGLRLERDRFDIRAAVVCYLAAGDFTHAASIWSTLSVSGNRGKSLQRGLQDLVEKLAVLKKATNYEMDDSLFNQKVSQYAEVLANSGRLVAGMKFLCLVGSESSDPSARNSTGILRDRIYNASPEAMHQAGIPPPMTLPFARVDVLPALPPAQPQPQASGYGSLVQQQQQQHHQPQQPQQASSYMPQQPQQPQQPYQQRQPAPYPGMQPPHPSYGHPQQPPQQGGPYGQPTAPMPPAVSPWGHQPPHQPPVTPPTARPPIAPTGPGFPTGPYRGVSTDFGQPPAAAAAARPHTGGPPYGGPSAPMMPPPPTRPSSNLMTGPPSATTMPQHLPQQQPAVHPRPSAYQMPPQSSVTGPYGSTPMMNGSPGNLPPQPSFPLTTAPPPGPPRMTNGFVPQQPLMSGPPSQGAIPAPGSSAPYAPGKSTAPTAGVVNLPQGMPVPWPIPTGTQQVGSTTQATAPANQKIQNTATSKGESVPMSPTDAAFVQRIVFNAHSQFSQHDASGGRESEKLRQTLNEMMNQLQSGSTSRQIQDLVLQYCRAVDVGDLTAAGQIQAQMVKTVWTKDSRVWLPSLKRIMAK